MKPCTESLEFRGQPALRLRGPGGAEAIVSCFGAQVLSWIPPDGHERLYLSKQAVFDGKTAIRGGVPVCFPQFAARGALPRHGLLRTRSWSLAAERAGDDYVLATFAVCDDAATQAIWPHGFQAELTVMLEADRLDLEFCVTNTGSQAFEFTGALHTYLRVNQVEDVALEGLYGHDYAEAEVPGRWIRDSGTHFSPDAAVDRVYRRISRPLLLRAAHQSVGLHQQGFPDAVVWNPWAVGTQALTDLPDEDWRSMLCVEAAVVEQPVQVTPGEEWYGRQTLLAL